MAKTLPEVDVLLVGLGWTGGILAKELSEAGLKVLALERGGPRSTAEDFAVPRIRDELAWDTRHGLMQDTAKDTLTIRNTPDQEALPMRRLGSFLPGEGVGGACGREGAGRAYGGRADHPAGWALWRLCQPRQGQRHHPQGDRARYRHPRGRDPLDR